MQTQSNTKIGRLKPRPKPEEKPKNDRINCHICEYFYITWQNATPYGCKAHGFQSAQIPSVVVFSSSGEPCLLYRPKV